VSPQYSGPYGPVIRYTVAIGLPLEARTARFASCTSQGPHRAAAAAVRWLLRLEPSAAVGTVEIELTEDDFESDSEDLLDYWDVA